MPLYITEVNIVDILCNVLRISYYLDTLDNLCKLTLPLVVEARGQETYTYIISL